MTNDRFYQRLSEKLADLPDDPAFDAEGTWVRVQPPLRRRAVGAWLWPTGLAASVLLMLGLSLFKNQPDPPPDAVATLNVPAPRIAQRAAAVPRPETFRLGPGKPRPVRQVLPQPTAPPEAAPAASPALPEPEPAVTPVEVAAKAAPQPEAAETPGTVVLTIPVPGEDAPPVRKPFVTRLFKQWKRYNRGETVDWEDLGLKSSRLTKARTDSTRTSN